MLAVAFQGETCQAGNLVAALEIEIPRRQHMTYKKRLQISNFHREKCCYMANTMDQLQLGCIYSTESNAIT